MPAPPRVKFVNHNVAAVAELADAHEGQIFCALNCQNAFQFPIKIFIGVKAKLLSRNYRLIAVDNVKTSVKNFQSNHQFLKFFKYCAKFKPSPNGMAKSMEFKIYKIKFF